MLTPTCWIQLGTYSAEFDAWLSRMLRESSFSNFDGYTVRLGNRILWTRNHPYASFRPAPHESPEVRASRATTLEAMDKLVGETFNEN